MSNALLVLIRNNGGQVDVLHASENILFDLRIFFLDFPNQFFYFLSLRSRISAVDRASFGKATSALDEMQSVIIPPCLDILFP